MIRPSQLKTVIALAATVAGLAALAGGALANVYPTSLTQSANALAPGQTVSLGYLLNEDATNVTVSVLNASSAVVRTITPGAQTKGVQSVLWDGKDNSAANLPAGNYSFRVNTTGAARSTWTGISTDGTLNNFEQPRGVAVNNNPGSPNYGRVYVSNSQNLATALGRAMDEGVYMLNADLSDTGIPGGTGPHAGGVDWTTGGVVSPYRIQVGPDDSVYVTDWSDPHGGLWQAPANLSGNWTEILDSSGGRDADGLTPVHGSISDVVITGTGANRVLYTADEDFYDVNTQSPASAGSIQKYDIGTQSVFTTAPTSTFYDDAVGGFNINFLNSLALDKRGDFWYSQNRAAGTDKASLVQIDSTGTIVWDSLAQLGSPDPLRTTQGIAYDPVNDVIALVTTTGGNIIIFDPVNKAVVTQFAFGAGTGNTDVSFDNAGNLYVTNRTDEFLRVWSPPSSEAGFVANQFSTDSLAPLGSIALSAAPANDADFNNDGRVDAADLTLWKGTFGGAANGTTGDANGDGKADGTDFLLWQQQYKPTAPVGSVPEPAAGVLAALGVAACGLRARRRG